MNSQGDMLYYRTFQRSRRQDISSTVPTWKLTQPAGNASRRTDQQLHPFQGFYSLFQTHSGTYTNQAPQATVVMSHDDDWCDIFGEVRFRWV
jgi:hypothetical protein